MRTGRTILFIILISFLAACSSDDAPGSVEPQLIIGDAVNVSRTEATLTGRIELRGKTSEPKMLFFYGTTTDMDMESGQASVVDGNVSARITGLLSNATYYYCMQSDNGRVKLRSEMNSFTTEPGEKPVLSNLNTLSQGPVSVTVGYSITDDGGEEITETGCYVAEKGSSEVQKNLYTSKSSTEETYKVIITGLKQNTTYVITAFAVNRNGESKSVSMEHTTNEAIVVKTAGELSSAIGESELTATSINIEGELNSEDISFLRRLLGAETSNSEQSSLRRTVDLTDITIVKGSTSYDGEHFTDDKVVGTGMFSGCYEIKSLSLPDNATSVQRNALSDCSNLETLKLPVSATSIVPSAGCSALKDITVSPASTKYKSIDGVLYDAEGATLVWLPIGLSGKYEFPSTLKTIGKYACQELTVSELTIPSNIKDVETSAFCNGMFETMTFSDNVETLCTSTFQNCSKLKTVYLGSMLALVNDYAFYGCPLESLHVKAEIPPVCSEKAFNSPDGNVFSLCTLYVPKGCKSIYRNHEQWGKFKLIVEE